MDTDESDLKKRLKAASAHALKARLRRIDALLLEIAKPVGAALLAVREDRRFLIVDLDRLLRRIEKVDAELESLARATRKKDGLLASISQDISNLADALAVRELQAKRERHLAQLGLALLAQDGKALESTAPTAAAVRRRAKDDAARVDALFRQQAVVEHELSERARQGRIRTEPKELEKLVTKASDAVGHAQEAAKGKLKELGREAAKAAARQSGRAIVGIAKGAFKLSGLYDSAEEELDDATDDEPRFRAPRGHGKSDKNDVPTLIRDLARLRSEGLLTESEFQAKKRELLDRL